jgi:hypothetical protein
MENLYHNPIITAILTILALIVIGNSGLQIYMLNGPPILIEKDLTNIPVAHGFSGSAGFIHPILPIIYLNPTNEATTRRVLRHEYQHYMQKAILSPLVFNIAYWFEDVILNVDYSESWFEKDAIRASGDNLIFGVFDWQTKKIMEVKP